MDAKTIVPDQNSILREFLLSPQKSETIAIGYLSTTINRLPKKHVAYHISLVVGLLPNSLASGYRGGVVLSLKRVTQCRIFFTCMATLYRCQSNSLGIHWAFQVYNVMIFLTMEYGLESHCTAFLFSCSISLGGLRLLNGNSFV